MEEFFAAVDLGTTSVETSLLRQDGTVAAKFGFRNPQSRFGSDVISRMTYLQKHPTSTELKDLTQTAILAALRKMLSWQGDYDTECIRRVLVTCNTVMGAILQGALTASLSHAPFGMPVTKHTETKLKDELPMVIPVGTSAFLGSDVCAGAWALPLGEDEMLMDLGTNGEMLLRHDGKLFGSSAACGPAFENCTRSQGIYGSTTLSVLANLLRTGKLSGDGILPEEIAESGIDVNGIHITPKIIHDIQLAVGAIYATFSMLLRRAGLEPDRLKTIYLAGGFGFHLSLRDAVTVGLIPEQLRDRVVVSGNTSLAAAEKLVMEGTAGLHDYDTFRKDMQTLQFAGDSEYESCFYESMTLTNRRI